jgi:Uma2 family endonuclease
MTIVTPTSRRRRRTPDLRHMEPEEIYALAERLQGRPAPGLRMSEAEFEAWCDEDVRAEWIGGEVILMPPVSDEHSELNIWFIRLIGEHVEQNELGVLRQDMFVRLASQRRRRVPDLMFVAHARLHLLRPTYFEGAPDLIFEIISPDSQSRDRREKFDEYEKAGVREYWIVDPLSKTVEAYRLQGRKFRLVDEQDGILASSVLRNFRLRTDWLWRKPLPKVSTALKQMRGKPSRR